MNSSTNIAKDLADKDKINFIAAFFHHLDIVFSIISIIVFFENEHTSITGIALTLLILERVYMFFYTGVKTYQWSQAIMALIFFDYIGEMCKSQEGRGMRLFTKKYVRVFMISSPFAIFCFFTFYTGMEDRGLTLTCGIIHLLNTAQTNLEYYTQNILTIKAKQKIYVYTFIACEFFYRLVFLSFFRDMIEGKGMIGYMIGEFIVNFFLELYVCKREGQEKSFWIFSTFQKAWSGAFYFRLEDTMVQDADEWNSENRNLDTYRQQLRISNQFKSFRSKLFITFRLLENVFLTIVGIAQFSKEKNHTGLFVLAIILVPFYLIWHFKYCRYNYSTSDTANNNNNINDSAVQAAVQTISNKYRDENPHKQLNSEQNAIENTPQNKYTPQKDPYNIYPSENTYQSDIKKPKQKGNHHIADDPNPFNNIQATPPIASKNHQRNLSKNNNYNQNVDIEEGQFKGVKRISQEQQQHPIKNQKFSHSEKKKSQDSKNLQKLQDDQDYEDDDPYGQADINAFAIE